MQGGTRNKVPTSELSDITKHEFEYKMKVNVIQLMLINVI